MTTKIIGPAGPAVSSPPNSRKATVICFVRHLHSQVRRLMIYPLTSRSVWIKCETLTKSLSILNVSTYWLNKFHQGSSLFASCPQRLHEVCDDKTVYVWDTLMPNTSLATCPSSLVWKQCWLILEAASIYDVIRPVLSPAALPPTTPTLPPPTWLLQAICCLFTSLYYFYNRDRCVEIAAVGAFCHTVRRGKTHRSQGGDFLSLSHIPVRWEIFMTISGNSSYFACHPVPPTSIYRLHLTKGNKL